MTPAGEVQHSMEFNKQPRRERREQYEFLFYILFQNFTNLLINSICISVSELSSDEYEKTAFKSKGKLVVVVHVLRKRRICSFHVVLLQRMAKKSTNSGAPNDKIFL